jgi:hypothetical protein
MHSAQNYKQATMVASDEWLVTLLALTVLCCQSGFQPRPLPLFNSLPQKQSDGLTPPSVSWLHSETMSKWLTWVLWVRVRTRSNVPINVSQNRALPSGNAGLSLGNGQQPRQMGAGSVSVTNSDLFWRQSSDIWQMHKGQNHRIGRGLSEEQFGSSLQKS